MIDQEKLESLRTLAAKALEKNKAHQTIHVAVEREAPDAGSFNRVLGPPLGVTDETWPRFTIVPESHGDYVESDSRMEHVFTVDLRDMKLPHGVPAGARAASFFVSNRHLNLAYERPNQECRLYFWSEEDVARGFYEGTLPVRKYGPGETQGFDLVAVEVPSLVFSSSACDSDEDLEALRRVVSSCSARFGGEEMWVQSDPDEDDFDGGGDDDSDDEDSDDGDSDGEDSDDSDSDGEADEPKRPLIQDLGLRGAGGFFLQFDEYFGGVNLGDSGVMYVYGDGTAFWQCC